MQRFTKIKNKLNSICIVYFLVALHGCEEVVKQLLSVSSVNCNAKDSCGTTPIHDAVRSGSLETLKALISTGTDLTALNNEGYG